jgi:hypothetical protein
MGTGPPRTCVEEHEPRLTKVEGGTTTRFVYDGAKVVLERDGDDETEVRYTHEGGSLYSDLHLQDRSSQGEAPPAPPVWLRLTRASRDAGVAGAELPMRPFGVARPRQPPSSRAAWS